MNADAPFVTRHHRGLVVTLSVVAVVLLLVVVAALIPIPYYAIAPGDALGVSGLVSVPASAAHAHPGAILLTDVELLPLHAIDWPFYRLNGDDEVDPKTQIIGTATPAQYNEQGVIDMTAARQAATVVGLRAVGYPANAVDNGVVDDAPEAASPASAVLDVGDVVTAVDHRPTMSLDELTGLLSEKRPGATATVGFHMLGSSDVQTVSVVLGEAHLTAESSETCLRAGATSALSIIRVDGHPRACLGILFVQMYKTTGAPFPVTIDSEGIVGPSAGLAFSLGLIEKLDPADLTGGRRIAATGTMSLDGSVGDVGGVAQKTVAVRNAGATVFFVPIPELAVARAHAGPTLKVFAVASLDQAIQDLEHLGGQLDHVVRSQRS